MKERLNYFGWPPWVWFVFFTVCPLSLVVVTSFLSKEVYGGIAWSFTFDNFVRSFDWLYLKIFLKSFALSSLTTLFCFFLGYPMAWSMATAPAQRRTVLIFLLAIPFLTNLIIRIYSIKLFVGYDGPLISLLRFFDIENDPFLFSQNTFLVFYGMISTYLPFMVFPIYAALDKFDFSLLEAHADLGGYSFTAIRKILLPNTKAAVINGCLLVFVPSLGEYLIPDLLGGAKTMLIGNVITDQFLKSRDWPFGSVLALGLIFILSITLAISERFAEKHENNSRS